MTNNSQNHSFWRKALKGERLPAAIVDLDAFDRNVQKLSQLANGKRIRIATKSVRVPELIQRALSGDRSFDGLMCYSPEEASFWSELDPSQDLLVAYPSANDPDFKILRQLHARSAGHVSIVVDEPEHLTLLSNAMRGVKKPFPVIIEIDASSRILGHHIGVRRSPIRSTEDILRVFEIARSCPELRIRGAMIYEAQIAGLPDTNPFKKWLNPAAHYVRNSSIQSVARRRNEIAQLFLKHGISFAVFNGGGTGSFNFAAKEGCLTEITAGSALFSPHLFDYYSNIRFEPACFFALQVVRKSDPGFVTCQGGGYISSGEPGWDKVPLPFCPVEAKLTSAEACGEVQTPLKIPQNLDIKLGDPIIFRAAKAGELAERFNEMILMSSGKIVSSAKTYRGMGKCFI